MSTSRVPADRHVPSPAPPSWVGATSPADAVAVGPASPLCRLPSIWRLSPADIGCRRRPSGRRAAAIGRNALCIGHTRHCGLRALQCVAPKSISAWLKSNTCLCGSTRLPTSPRGASSSRGSWIALADEDAEQHARDVGVEDRGALAEREAADRAGGVFADALERQQRLVVARQLAAVIARPPAARSTAAAAGGCCSRAGATSATLRPAAPRPGPRTTGTCPATRDTSAARDRPASAAA